MAGGFEVARSVVSPFPAAPDDLVYRILSPVRPRRVHSQPAEPPPRVPHFTGKGKNSAQIYPHGRIFQRFANAPPPGAHPGNGFTLLDSRDSGG